MFYKRFCSFLIMLERDRVVGYHIVEGFPQFMNRVIRSRIIGGLGVFKKKRSTKSVLYWQKLYLILHPNNDDTLFHNQL